MSTTGRQITVISIFTLMLAVLVGCATNNTTIVVATSTPIFIPASSNPDFSLAQATVDSGESQLADIDRQSTQVSLNMTQAVNAALMATQSVDQGTKADLAFEATSVSQNITQAVRTQQFLAQQTRLASQVTATAQSAAVAATQLVFVVQVTQTAQNQALLNTQTVQAMAVTNTRIAQTQAVVNTFVEQTRQAVLAVTAYPLTATPLAKTQAAALAQEYNQEQQNFIQKIVSPLIPILAVIDLVLFVLVIVFAYRKLIPLPLLRILGFSRGNDGPRPFRMIDVAFADYVPRPPEAGPAPASAPVDEESIQIDIVNAAEPPYNHWIAEVEHQLDVEGEQQP
jgi:hypothetical protein